MQFLLFSPTFAFIFLYDNCKGTVTNKYHKNLVHKYMLKYFMLFKLNVF